MKVSLKLLAVLVVLLGVVCAVQAQSEDIDNPTPVSGNLISGEGDGKAQTVYYSFTATPGDVKVTVDAKTDGYSTPLVVSLLDDDGKELLQVYNVAVGAGHREVKTRRFVREQKVILKISLREDAQVKLITYKIKLDGAIQSAPGNSEMSTINNETTNAGAQSSAQAKKKGVSEMMKKVSGLVISNPAGEKLTLPTNGQLVVELKDGSVQEIDLSTVKKISVKQ
jgi:hypothetical protein